MERPRSVAFQFQISKHRVEFHADETANILSNDPSGPRLMDDSKHLRPDRTVIFLASSLPGVTERLAGEPPGKQSCSSESGAVEGEDVGDEERSVLPTTVSRFGKRLGALADSSVTVAPIAVHTLGVGNSPEPCLEDFLTEGLDFTERDGAESRPSCGEGEAPNAREKVNMREVIHLLHLSWRLIILSVGPS
jgi:hypothetical protein